MTKDGIVKIIKEWGTALLWKQIIFLQIKMSRGEKGPVMLQIMSRLIWKTFCKKKKKKKLKKTKNKKQF